MSIAKRINVLSKNVSQLIAAGEVVESPASVIKELLENSIDAGATRITAEIKNGGIKLIKISDNGCGIHSGDIKNAFLRHATSKLKNAEDLNEISSLGFRGEALASISAVSKIEITTKSQDEEVGTHFKIEGGASGEISECGCSQGTVICVKDIFYNTPARMKFLKKDISEANACSSVIDKLALSHPEISFKFIRDGKEALFTPGDGKISSVIYSVYGKDFFEGMIPVQYELNSVKISGYISRPRFSKATRLMQNFFVNGRYVKIKIGSVALEEAFKNSVMVGKFPYCVIYIDIPSTMVDVNVHPSKTEVKFAQEKALFEAIYYGVKSALLLQDGVFANAHVSSHSPKSNCLIDGVTFSGNGSLKTHKIDFSLYTPKESSESKVITQSPGAVLPVVTNESAPQGLLDTEEEIICENNTPINFKMLEFHENSDKPDCVQESFLKSSLDRHFKVVGEIFKCYIVVETEEKIVLIDKHAAHERIIFEKLTKNEIKNVSQNLLEPVVVTLAKEEYSAILENVELLSQTGYEAEDFGSGAVIVRAAPMYVPLSEISDSISEIASYLSENRKTLYTKKTDWLYHNIACRAAIKAGSKSSIDEIYALVKKLMDNPDVRHCPHGRPIYVCFNQKFIEKQFGRT